MALIIFVILAGLEIALSVMTCRKGYRLIVRAVQTVVVVIAMLIPLGQKWRFAPVLGWIILLLIIAAISKLVRHNKENGNEKTRKTAGTIFACVLCILMTGVSLIPAFVFTGYNGLPVTGEFEIGRASAILVDESRTDPFEQDGSKREVPVHFYYPKTEGQQYPLVIFSHGAFGYYQSNSSTYMELAGNGYVVAALDHPHHAFFTKDTDGKMIIVDRDFMNTALTLNDGSGKSPDECLALYREWMDLRTGDMDLAVDELERAAADGGLNDSWSLTDSSADEIMSVVNMMDTGRIGLMGHSMGGATGEASYIPKTGSMRHRTAYMSWKIF